MLHITDTIAIQDWELTESFSRASGPGGQNVNKVSTAVELRFEAERSPSLPAAARARLLAVLGASVTATVDETRSQARNREIARERLVELIRAALVAPRRRIATKPTHGSKIRRMDAKTRRGDIKSLRGRVDQDGD